MAKAVKAVDPNHMVTVGEEGFFLKKSPYASANPAYWAAMAGQDFFKNHAVKDIDFAAFHSWPDNWQVGLLQGNCLETAISTRKYDDGKPDYTHGSRNL
jgi:endo-1,4-beta-mannosidase